MDKIKNVYAKVAKYLQSVRTELKRVTWPSSQELKASTMVVLITLFIVTLFLWISNTVIAEIFVQMHKRL